MKIIINNIEKEIDQVLTLKGLITSMYKVNKNLIVLHNDNIIKENKREDILIKENDKIEIVQLIGGG